MGELVRRELGLLHAQRQQLVRRSVDWSPLTVIFPGGWTLTETTGCAATPAGRASVQTITRAGNPIRCNLYCNAVILTVAGTGLGQTPTTATPVLTHSPLLTSVPSVL